MLLSMRSLQRSPTSTTRRPIVSRWTPVMRSVERMELPSTKDEITESFLSVESVFILVLTFLGWASQNEVARLAFRLAGLSVLRAARDSNLKRLLLFALVIGGGGIRSL